jgi:hypothetical protein
LLVLPSLFLLTAAFGPLLLKTLSVISTSMCSNKLGGLLHLLTIY